MKRIIRHPVRVEEGIFEHAVAAMQAAEGKNYSEIWVLYVLMRGNNSSVQKKGKIKIISAWRYPGKSPARDPIPPEILREIRSIL